MATLGDMKTRIATEMVRDDLASGGENESILLNRIKEAVRHYTRENWWFLSTTTTATTTADQNYITRPTTIDIIQRVSIPAIGADLEKIDITEIERNDEPSVQTGQPCAFSEYGTQIRLWPVPNAVFTVKITGTTRLSELANNADTNVWTNEAQDLIVAHTKMALFRFPYRDEKGVQMALAEVQEALSALRRTNIDRLDMPVCAGW